MPVREQLIELATDELLLLYDRVRDTDNGTDEQHLKSAYPLLLKLGAAIVDLFGEGTSAKPTRLVSAMFTEPELWLLRSKVATSDGTQENRLLGVKLTVKILRALLACDAPVFLDAESDMVDEAMTAERRDALRKLAGGEA
jgi:hypothetical protein